MALDKERLILGEFSLLHIGFEERFRAAAAAGFTDVSLFWKTIQLHREQGGRDADFRDLADTLGLRIAQLEFATPRPAAEREEFRTTAQDMADTAHFLGCETVHVVPLDPRATRQDIVECLRILGGFCAVHSLSVGMEFVPFLSVVENLPDALSITRDTGLANVGVVLDAMHFQRGGAQWDALESAGPAEIVTFQLDDAPLVRPGDDYGSEAMEGRLLPGDGGIDLPRIIATLERIGFTGPLTMEVANRELNALPSTESTCIMAKSGSRLIA